MPMDEQYAFTQEAWDNLHEAIAWSKARWGQRLTNQYIDDLHAGFCRLASDHGKLPSREELTVDTGLSIYPIREHYVVFEPVGEQQIIIVALIHQVRDVPAVLRGKSWRIKRELKAVRQAFAEGTLTFFQQK